MIPQNIEDLTLRRFGRLVVMEYAGKNGRGKHQWRCKCDCKNYAVVDGYSLISGNTMSCGCLSKDIASATHKTHGESSTRLYRIWSNMRSRCTIPSSSVYAYYGGRGISVCKEWNTYGAFKDWALSNGYDNSQTIDRIDVDGDYEPSNCRWVDMNFQANNKRSNYLIEHDGRTMTAMQWSREVGISADVIKYRIRHNWTTAEALTIPPGGKRNA